MKRLIIVCEGPTEQEFCNSVLAPELQKHQIYVDAPTVKHSNGGIVPWHILKGQLMNHLREGDAYVTMLVDYYGIKARFGFPGWQEAMAKEDKLERLYFLCKKMKEDLPENLRSRFIPYIQLHEFEGLLFSDVEVFVKSFNQEEVDMNALREAVATFETSELINDSPQTAPSKRLEKAVFGYSKVLYGNYLAMDMGLDMIRKKCPLFNEWVNTLISSCS